MNALRAGLTKSVEPPKGGCLFISDEVPNVPRARIFNPMEHHFNPLQGIDYKKAREIANVLYTIYPQGEDTLTVRGGRRGLARFLQKFSRLDALETHLSKKAAAHERDKKNNEPLSATEAEVIGVVSDVLLSPVLRRVLCNPTNFSFNPRSTILARINRAELGDFDALVLGLFLMAHFKGQIVVEDGGFYLREQHISLIRERRLIVGVNTLAELPPKLRQAVLLIGDKEASGTTFEDAELLAKYAGLRPDPTRDDNPYNRFVREAMA